MERQCGLIGFGDEELARLLAEDAAEGLTDAAAVPELPDLYLTPVHHNCYGCWRECLTAYPVGGSASGRWFVRWWSALWRLAAA